MQLHNRHFLKDPLNIQEGFKADATAEQVFFKRPPQIVLGVWSSKSGRNWATGVFIQTLRICLEEILEVQADATAQQTFSRRPPQKNLGVLSSKSGCNCATGIFWRNTQGVGLDVEADATA
jgi:hypothetical protein